MSINEHRRKTHNDEIKQKTQFGKNSIDFIRKKLIEQLSPTELEIIDDGALHAGHTGAKGGGHYTVIIAAPAFEGKNLIECHRLVYQSLGNVVGNEIHALRIQIK